ncbi:MAG: recombinase family protein [Candidatus Saccharibacteria bacterium]|nr:recombinase family protein [Candidatus Saccharibacteria bacterium]MCB9834571.1 recombinase family protein [Candidatus Nomurabacteria bacterium]
MKDGKIDGIIAWHPDRLARNMVEAGKIIDMLDKELLRDLKFHSHAFDNSSNGKMMLSMLFVFAKHYSDDLSDKVKRGVRNRAGEGKSGGTPKHGYKQVQGIYSVDTHNNNHELIKTAWHMRAEGTALPEIAKYLNDNQYSKYYTTDDDYRIMKVSPAASVKCSTTPSILDG